MTVSDAVHLCCHVNKSAARLCCWGLIVVQQKCAAAALEGSPCHLDVVIHTQMIFLGTFGLLLTFIGSSLKGLASHHNEW